MVRFLGGNKTDSVKNYCVSVKYASCGCVFLCVCVLREKDGESKGVMRRVLK